MDDPNIGVILQTIREGETRDKAIEKYLIVKKREEEQTKREREQEEEQTKREQKREEEQTKRIQIQEETKQIKIQQKIIEAEIRNKDLEAKRIIAEKGLNELLIMQMSITDAGQLGNSVLSKICMDEQVFRMFMSKKSRVTGIMQLQSVKAAVNSAKKPKRPRSEAGFQKLIVNFVNALSAISGSDGEKLISMKILDTSGSSPLTNRFSGRAKPDISLFHRKAEWTYAIAFGELKNSFGDNEYKQAVGQLIDRFSNAMRCQIDRKELHGFVLAPNQIQFFAIRNRANVYCSHKYKFGFELGNEGLILLIAFLISKCDELGFKIPIVPQALYDYENDQQVELLDDPLLLHHSLRSEVFKVPLISSISNNQTETILKIHAQPADFEAERNNLATLKRHSVPGVPNLEKVVRVKNFGERNVAYGLLISPVGEHLNILSLDYMSVTSILYQIATTLQNAHDIGLVYPDVSFDNIMFARESDGTIKGLLIDWEFAGLNPTVQSGGYKHLFCSINISRARYRQVDYKITLRDCLESLFYVLMFVAAKHHLPWSHSTIIRTVYGDKQSAMLSEFRHALVRIDPSYRKLLVDYRDLLFGVGFAINEITVDAVKQLLQKPMQVMKDEEIVIVKELQNPTPWMLNEFDLTKILQPVAIQATEEEEPEGQEELEEQEDNMTE